MKTIRNLFKRLTDTLMTSSDKVGPTISSKTNTVIENDAYEKGLELYKEKKSTEALKYFDIAIELGRYEDNVFELRGLCLQEMQYYYDAIDDFNKAIKLFPQDPNLYFCRSICYGSTLKIRDQISDLEKAIELSKVNNETNSYYHDAAKKMGYNNATNMYEINLISPQRTLEKEIEREEIFRNATSEKKLEMIKHQERWREAILAHVKKRNQN